MDFAYLLTSLDGRIARRPFWLAAVALAVVLAVLFLVLEAVLPPEPTILLVTILTLYPSIALVVKRLHDLGLPAMPRTAIFIGPSLIANVLQAVGATVTTMSFGGHVVPTLTPLGWMLQIVVLGVGAWAFWLLGLKRGDDWRNSYGPDPLAA